MKMHGQDTLSIVSIGLVNQGLKAGAERLITRFDYREGEALVEGRFGPWQVLTGGSAQLLHVDIPIAEGTMSGLPGGKMVDIGGVALRLEISLRLVPAPSGGGGHELRFDLERSLTLLRAGPVAPISVVDPTGKLSGMEKAALAEAAADCLAAHVEQLSYVFASVGSGATGALAMPYSSWRYLETGDGRGFLAIMGALDPAAEEGVDPDLLKGGAQTVFALSKRAFLTRIVEPYLTTSFRPRSGFAYDATKEIVRSTNVMRLPDLSFGVWSVSPTITSLAFGLGTNVMTCDAVTSSAMPLGTTFNCTVSPRMKFVLSDHRISFRPDPHPAQTHSVGLPGILDTLIGWLVNWIVGFFADPINQVVSSIADHMQAMNAASGQPVTWSGIRAFQADAAELSDCLWMADMRSV